MAGAQPIGQGDGQSQQGQIPYGQLEGVGGADCLNGQAQGQVGRCQQ